MEPPIHSSEPWFTIHGSAILEALRAVHSGANPAAVYAQLKATGRRDVDGDPSDR